MQEEVTRGAVTLIVDGAKLSEQVFEKAVKKFLEEIQKMLIDLTQQATVSRKSPIYWTDRMIQCSQKQKGEHHHGTYS